MIGYSRPCRPCPGTPFAGGKDQTWELDRCNFLLLLEFCAKEDLILSMNAEAQMLRSYH